MAVTDMEGNVPGASDDIEIDFPVTSNQMTIYINNGQTLYLFTAPSDYESEDKVRTFIYRGHYKKTGDGKIEFLYY